MVSSSTQASRNDKVRSVQQSITATIIQTLLAALLAPASEPGPREERSGLCGRVQPG
jgi:hypothetical protein